MTGGEPITSTDTIVFRKPRFEEGGAIHNLIQSSPPLDLNSPYAYYILCRDFSRHSIVADCGGIPAGYVSAYIRPDKSDTLFVWQVAVSPDFRGRGIGKRMLAAIVADLPPEVSFMETTISPSNTASQNLFHAFARSGGHPIQKTPFLTEQNFSGGHEPEELYTINLKETNHGNI